MTALLSSLVSETATRSLLSRLVRQSTLPQSRRGEHKRTLDAQTWQNTSHHHLRSLTRSFRRVCRGDCWCSATFDDARKAKHDEDWENHTAQKAVVSRQAQVLNKGLHADSESSSTGPARATLEAELLWTVESLMKTNEEGWEVLYSQGSTQYGNAFSANERKGKGLGDTKFLKLIETSWVRIHAPREDDGDCRQILFVEHVRTEATIEKELGVGGCQLFRRCPLGRIFCFEVRCPRLALKFESAFAEVRAEEFAKTMLAAQERTFWCPSRAPWKSARKRCSFVISFFCLARGRALAIAQNKAA